MLCFPLLLQLCFVRVACSRNRGVCRNRRRIGNNDYIVRFELAISKIYIKGIPICGVCNQGIVSIWIKRFCSDFNFKWTRIKCQTGELIVQNIAFGSPSFTVMVMLKFTVSPMPALLLSTFSSPVITIFFSICCITVLFFYGNTRRRCVQTAQRPQAGIYQIVTQCQICKGHCSVSCGFCLITCNTFFNRKSLCQLCKSAPASFFAPFHSI